MSKFAVAALIIVVTASLGACSSDGDEQAKPGVPKECELPTTPPELKEDVLPDFFSLEGSVAVTRAIEFKKGMTASGELRGSVKQALTRYRAAVEEEGFDIVNQDYEGFEAELYLQRKKEIGYLSLRESPCDGTLLAYLKLVRS